MEEYKLKLKMSEEVVALKSEKYGIQVWSLSKITKRHKGDNCTICEESIGNSAYRPITNLSNRMDRICVNCIKELKDFTHKEKKQ